MKLSRTARYALRSVLYLAEQTHEQPVTAGRLARELSIPENYLSKVLFILAQRGLLESSRGPAGGFRLAVPPDRLSLLRVIRSFEELEDRGGCLVGYADCPSERSCPVHGQWRDATEEVASFLARTSVAEAASETEHLTDHGGPGS